MKYRVEIKGLLILLIALPFFSTISCKKRSIERSELSTDSMGFDPSQGLQNWYTLGSSYSFSITFYNYLINEQGASQTWWSSDDNGLYESSKDTNDKRAVKLSFINNSTGARTETPYYLYARTRDQYIIVQKIDDGYECINSEEAWEDCSTVSSFLKFGLKVGRAPARKFKGFPFFGDFNPQETGFKDNTQIFINFNRYEVDDQKKATNCLTELKVDKLASPNPEIPTIKGEFKIAALGSCPGTAFSILKTEDPLKAKLRFQGSSECLVGDIGKLWTITRGSCSSPHAVTAIMYNEAVDSVRTPLWLLAIKISNEDVNAAFRCIKHDEFNPAPGRLWIRDVCSFYEKSSLKVGEKEIVYIEPTTKEYLGDDLGYPDSHPTTRGFKRGFYDIDGSGNNQNYCRVVGVGNTYVACSEGPDSKGAQAFKFSTEALDQGYAGTSGIFSIVGHPGLFFCRGVGNNSENPDLACVQRSKANGKFNQVQSWNKSQQYFLMGQIGKIKPYEFNSSFEKEQSIPRGSFAKAKDFGSRYKKAERLDGYKTCREEFGSNSFWESNAYPNSQKFCWDCPNGFEVDIFQDAYSRRKCSTGLFFNNVTTSAIKKRIGQEPDGIGKTVPNDPESMSNYIKEPAKSLFRESGIFYLCRDSYTKVLGESPSSDKACETDCSNIYDEDFEKAFYDIGNGHCYACPKGFDRTLTSVTSDQACKRRDQ